MIQTGLMIKIDGKEIKLEKGMTVYEAARSADIYIPTLCHHPDLKPYGGCSLCIVEIEKIPGFPTSCTMPASDGMVVKTNTPQLQMLRRNILELLLSEHPYMCLMCDRKGNCDPYRSSIRKVGATTGCQFCPKNKRCELQKVVDYVELKEVTLPYSYKQVPVLRGDPFIDRDYNLCILCGRCVRVCQDVRNSGAISFTFRGNKALVGTAFGESLSKAGCRFCASCVDVCPTGALSDKHSKWAGESDRSVTTICPYCGLGCRMSLEIKGDKLISAVPSGGINKGQACVRGRFGIVEITNNRKRLKKPLIRKDGILRESSWESAVNTAAEGFKKYKSDEVAVICCAETTNEDNYILQKFARVALGTNNIDHYARLCYAPTINGLSRVLGIGATTNSIEQVESAGCVLVIGIDTSNSQPLMDVYLKRALNNNAKIIIASPTFTAACRSAELWLQYNPGTESVLLAGLMKIIIDENLQDTSFISDRCDNYETFIASLTPFPYNADYVSRITGISRSQLFSAARLFATSRSSCIIYGDKLTQQYNGTANVSAAADLAILTGNIGRFSSGVNSWVGMNNVQGACDMGVMPDSLPGYQSLKDVSALKKFETAWGIKLNSTAGLTLTEILDAVRKGQVKAVYLIGDDISLHGKLYGLEFLVTQGMFPTEIGLKANVCLPSASFTEKNGTFTSCDRRIQLIKQGIVPSGDSKADWWITCQLAKAMGEQGFEYENASQIITEAGNLSSIYSNISYDLLEDKGIQWPYNSTQNSGAGTLYQDAFNSCRFSYIPIEFQPPPDSPADDEYPLVLTTESSPYFFNSGAISAGLAEFSILSDKREIILSTSEANSKSFADGESVRVISRWGAVDATVKTTPDILPVGVVVMPLHIAQPILNPIVDPKSKTPEYQVCAVKVEKIPVE
jgi:formate dehydrogenase (NADP+) alpha subunit